MVMIYALDSNPKRKIITMGIGSVDEKYGQVRVFDENGRLLFVRSGDLMGYTGSTVTIRNMNMNTTYDAAGRVKYVR